MRAAQHRRLRVAASCASAHRHGCAPAPRPGSCRRPRWHRPRRRRPAPRHRRRWRGTPVRAGTRGCDTVAGVANSATCLTATSRGGRVVAPLPFGQRLDQRHEHAQHPLVARHPAFLHPPQRRRAGGVAGQDHQVAARIEQPLDRPWWSDRRCRRHRARRRAYAHCRRNRRTAGPAARCATASSTVSPPSPESKMPTAIAYSLVLAPRTQTRIRWI